MSNKLQIPDKEEIEQHYFTYGVSLSDVARKYKTSNATVRKWMNFHGIERKSQKTASSEKNSLSSLKAGSNIEIIQSLKDNVPIKSIENTYRVSQATLYDIMNTHGIQRNTLSDQCKQGWFIKNRLLYDEQEIIASYKRNKSVQIVADDNSISRTCVRNILIRNNIDIEYELSSWISKGHKELIDFCKENNFSFVINDRKLISPLEIDIIIEGKVCVEYCGLYWHSENAGKQKNYHLNKLELVEAKGLRLFTVFEHYDLSIVKSMILHSLSKTPRKIYARKCEIKQITTSVSNKFETENHLMGFRPSKYYYGLYYDDELVQSMSFSKSRYDSKIDYEIIRSTLKKNTHVSGGISKLIKHFTKSHSASTLITYVDRTYGSGQSYHNTNMTYSHKTTPNYYYFKSGLVYSRVSFQKHKLKKKLETFDINKTEYQNMVDNGWNRYWDCGNHVFHIKN